MTEIRRYAPDTNPSYPNGYADTNPLVKRVRIRSLVGTPVRGFPTQNTRMRIVRTHESADLKTLGTFRGQCKTMACKRLVAQGVTRQEK